MFTVKFLSFRDGEESQTSISVPCYQAYKRENGSYTISVCKDIGGGDGVDYHLMTDEMAQSLTTKEHRPFYHHCCFVENQYGKTIDKFRAL